jgi:hypothetical protein
MWSASKARVRAASSADLAPSRPSLLRRVRNCPAGMAINGWEMRVVPGLPQTEEYARAVISAGKPRDGRDNM